MSLTSKDLADMKQLMESVVNARLSETDTRFDAIDGQLNAVVGGFDENDTKLDEILNAVGGEIANHSDHIADHETRVTRLQKKIA